MYKNRKWKLINKHFNQILGICFKQNKFNLMIIYPSGNQAPFLLSKIKHHNLQLKLIRD